MPAFLLVVEFPGGAITRELIAEDVGHAAMLAQPIMREHPEATQACLCPKFMCRPLQLPRERRDE